jgi:D-psicose/D-tagatose/L-ribulose 3-epimerase
VKFGMNVLLWTARATPEHFPILAKIKETGYDGVEFPLFAETEQANCAAIGREVKRLGLACSAVTVMTPEADPISPDPAVRKAAVERLKQHIGFAATIGADILAGPLHSALGVFTGQGPTEDEKKRVTDVLRAAAEEAQKAKVRLAVEYLCRFESYFLTTARDAAALVQRVNHPAFGMMYDTFHANIEEKDPPSALLEAAPHVIHVHISENDRGTPGRGHVQWRETFQALRKVEYDGWLTIEAFGRALPEIAAATRVWRDFFPSREEVYQDGLKFMKKMWAESGNASM